VSVEHVEVLVEERSMAAMLEALLPRLLGTTSWQIHEHRSKADLITRLPARLRGYRAWLSSRSRIVVVVDRDDDDCHELKRRLELIAKGAGLPTRSVSDASGLTVVNRIAIEELEAWYFGDWDAVRAAYPRVPATIVAKAGFRAPDAISGGTWEAFERVMQNAGYFRPGGLRKVEAARAIAPHLDPTRNTSPSFQAVRRVFAEMHTP
jgi:hypothetical protein